ncbi:MAG TPA: hypothetical protein CFH84_05265 [Sulfurimonas sp. UBA12504]|nr:MAG: hypothetical protein A2019_06970 [Sulfurimonas sp. GWF2_37_8]DAB30217.1 MAG TPA: hypothetical protein CFH84_05265 [Sulfurimonas sp. UBA12504]
MKIWISDTQTQSHRLVRLNCENHSDYNYLGDLDDEALRKFLQEVKIDLAIEKKIKLLHYYGYLHLFVIHKR